MRISQEFYCGECVGYFLVRLNTAINHEVHVKCPNCGHEHRRCVVDGQIYDQGRYNTEVKETVLATKATYSKEPLTQRMKNAHEGAKHRQSRDGVVTSPMYDRWLEIAARERGET